MAHLFLMRCTLGSDRVTMMQEKELMKNGFKETITPFREEKTYE